MLYVTMPTFRTPQDLLERAVDSVLQQTHEDLRLVLIADGEPVDLEPDDRLVLFGLPENRGRYFADAVALAAFDEDDWWSPHDADDWSEPDRFARLLDVAAPHGAALAAYWKYEMDGRRTMSIPKIAGRGHRHVGHWCSGVYKVGRARDAGGILPNVRVSYDTLFVSLVTLIGPTGNDPTPGFHWQRRPGSLTSANGTSMQSSLRYQTRLKLRKIYAEAEQKWDRGLAVDMTVRQAATDEEWEEVDEHAARLRELLETRG